MSSLVTITKDTGLNEVMLELGWDITDEGKEDADLDLVMFLCDENYRCLGDSYQLTDPEGDSKLSKKVEKIVIAVTIYEAKERRQNFGLVNNAYIRIVDTEKEKEILRYNLSEDFSLQNTVVIGEIYRYKDFWKFKVVGESFNNEKMKGFWKFKAVGEGYNNEMKGLCDKYGVEYV